MWNSSAEGHRHLNQLHQRPLSAPAPSIDKRRGHQLRGLSMMTTHLIEKMMKILSQHQILRRDVNNDFMATASVVMSTSTSRHEHSSKRRAFWSVRFKNMPQHDQLEKHGTSAPSPVMGADYIDCSRPPVHREIRLIIIGSDVGVVQKRRHFHSECSRLSRV